MFRRATLIIIFGSTCALFPSVASADAGDVAATRAYLKASSVELQSMVANIPASEAGLKALGKACPGAFSGPPKGTLEPSRQAAKALFLAPIAASFVALFHPDAQASTAFLEAVKPLHWSAVKLTRKIHSEAEQTQVLANTITPDLCSDYKTMARSGYQTVPPDLSKLVKQLEGSPSEESSKDEESNDEEATIGAPKQLTRYERPDEHVLLRHLKSLSARFDRLVKRAFAPLIKLDEVFSKIFKEAGKGGVRSPPTKPRTSADLATTRNYLHAVDVASKAIDAQLAAGKAALQKLVTTVQDQCPMAATDFFSSERPEALIVPLEREVTGAATVTMFASSATAAEAFQRSVETLHWKDHSLTTLVRKSAASTGAFARLQAPDICADVRAWASTGFGSPPTSTSSFVSALESPYTPLQSGGDEASFKVLQFIGPGHQRALGGTNGLGVEPPEASVPIEQASLAIDRALGLVTG